MQVLLCGRVKCNPILDTVLQLTRVIRNEVALNVNIVYTCLIVHRSVEIPVLLYAPAPRTCPVIAVHIA